ncbi:MAG: M48 family metallopeptidase [Gammaproteobacteria bacterium]|nr:M48 family metallopeptidase [Gammaproteobacteria bacterium]
MNFFEAQQRARRRTFWLVLLFLLAVAGLIVLANIVVLSAIAFSDSGMLVASFGQLQQYFRWQTFTIVALLIILFIVLGSLYKMLSLSHGGASVAEMLGGRRVPRSTRELSERRMLNVVEEMAIASGISVPQVYLMEEIGINAFAAGTSPNNAVIGITTGALKHLKRDELQGVIAHEFSHIFNGDMRLNIRLMSVLHGILLLGLTGQYMLRMMRFMRSPRSGSKGGQAILVVFMIGLGLYFIGYVGFFFGQWIKSLVSRQREYLADASAVRYTRDQFGIANALKKIGGMGSVLINPAAAEYSHAYFSKGVEGALEFVFATHPPLDKRIRSIEPNWDGNYLSPKIPKPESKPKVKQSKDDQQDKQAILTNIILAGTMARGVLSTEEIINKIGTLNEEQIALAQTIIDVIPQGLRDAASDPFGARAVIYSLLLDWRVTVSFAQQDILEQLADPAVVKLTQELADEQKNLPEHAGLPLIELTMPALEELSSKQYQQFRSVVQTLISADKKVNLKEWVIQRLVIQQLDQYFGLRKPAREKYSLMGAVKLSAETILSLIAYTEHPEEVYAQQAFDEAKKAIGATAFKIVPKDEINLARLNDAIDELEKLKPPLKQRIIKALVTCIMLDGKASITGQELLRAVASCLDCPIPPLI